MNSSTSPVDIRPDHLEIVQGILREHLPAGFQVWVFGSRAAWTTKDSSDLDLAMEGAGELDYKAMVRLEVAFEESDLPYTVDVVDLNTVSLEFRRIVDGQRVPLSLESIQTHNNAGWKRVTLGEVCTKIGSGATPSGGKDVYLDEGPYTLIRSQNVYNDGFHRGGLAFIGEGHANELQNVEVFEEDVLLNITGDSVARVCQAAPDVLPARVNQHVAIIRPDSVSLYAGYLRYYLAFPDVQAMLLSWAGSGGTRNALTKAMIESLEIPLPPLAEQRAIAHILGTLDDKIELNRQMNQTLEEMARAIFQDWFVDFGPVRANLKGQEPYLPLDLWALFPDRLVDSELGQIPEGWEVKALGEVVEVVGGATPSTKIPGYWEGGTHRWATPKDLSASSTSILLETERRITEAGLAKISSGLLPRGSLLLSSRAPIGYLAITEEPTAINQGFIAMPPSERVSNLFMLHWCKAFHEEIVNRANGSTFLEINKSNFRRIQVGLPDEGIMAQFDQRVRSFYERIATNERKSQALAAQRDALLPKLVSGELRA